jgi:hypothetical protein
MRIINTYREPVDPDHVLTDAEIRDLCCELVPVDPCSEVGRVSVYDGADAEHRDFDEEAALAAARAEYPKARILGVQVEGIGPPSGTPCGKLYESWIGRNNCCEGVSDITIDDEATPDVLPHGGSIVVFWQGGTGLYQVSTSSNATHFSDGKKTAVGNGNSIELEADVTFCGSTSLEVTDGCSTATVLIRSDLGQWVFAGYGCQLSGREGEHLGSDENGQRVIQAIYGNIKQLDYQVQNDSFPPPYTSGYFGGLYFVDGSPATLCPATNQAVCTPIANTMLRHCQCANAAGYPLTNNPTCLAANIDGIAMEYQCPDGEWLSRPGALALYCSWPGHVVEGGVWGYKMNWLEAGTPPVYYKWMC